MNQPVHDCRVIVVRRQHQRGIPVRLFDAVDCNSRRNCRANGVEVSADCSLVEHIHR
jgi:hypothetical protein